MSAHTPGPWVTNERLGDKNAPASVVYVASGGLAYAVAMCPKYVNPKDWISREGALIAAAPELLAALKAMLEEDDGGRAAAQARAAIAKAGGRE